MTSLLAWVLDPVLLLPGKSRVEEDNSISHSCVERCVEDEEAPIVAHRWQRTWIISTVFQGIGKPYSNLPSVLRAQKLVANVVKTASMGIST